MWKMYGLAAVMTVSLLSCQLQTLQVKAKPSIAIPAGELSLEVGKSLGEEISKATSAGGMNLVLGTSPAPGEWMMLTFTQDLIKVPLSDFFDGGDINLAAVDADIPETSLVIPKIGGDTLSFPVTLNPTASGSVRIALPPVSGRQTIPLGADDKFQSGIIGTGNLTVTMPQPPGVNSQKLSITLKQADGQGNEPTRYTGQAFSNPAVFNLVSTTLGKGDIILEYTWEVDVNGLTQAFSGDASVQFNVAEFDEVQFLTPELDLSETIEVPYSSDKQQLVDYLDVDPLSKVTVDFVNGLPTPITFNLSSAALGISEAPLVVSAGGGTGSREYIVTNTRLDVDAPGAQFDFIFTAELNGFDKASGILTLNNVVPEVTYTFRGTVSADIIPVGVGLKDLSTSPISGTFPSDGSKLPLDSLGKFLPPEIKFNSVPITVNLTLLPDVAGTLTLTARYTKDGVTQTSPIFDGTQDHGAFDTFGDNPETFPVAGDLAAVLNARSDDGIILEYALAFDTAEIDLHPDVPINIRAGVVLDIPFSLKADLTGVADPITLTDSGDIKWASLKLADPDPLDFTGKGDMIGRKGNVVSTLDDVINGLKSAEFQVETLENSSGLNLALQVLVKDPESTDASPLPDLSSAIILDGGTVSSLKFSPKWISALQTFPFEPKIRILVPEGDFGIKSTGVLNLRINLMADSDVDLKISLDGGSK